MRSVLAIGGAFAIAAAVPVESAEIHGRVSASYYNHDDKSANQDYNITRTNLRLDASDFMGDDVSFHFKGSTRNKGTHDFNREIPETRIDTANVEIKKIISSTDMIVGRSYIDDVPGARVDGVNVKHFLGEQYGLGAFLGLMPDPYQDRFKSDFTTYGAYGFWREPKRGASLGYVSSLYKGKEDQTYGYGSGYITPSDDISIYASVRSDHDKTGGGYKVTNLLASLNYRISRDSRITLSYNQYRATKRYESITYSVNDEQQKTYRVFATTNATKSTRVYGSIDMRTRDTDKKSASLITAGVKQKDIMSIFYIDANYKNIRYFTSNGYRMFIAMGADPREDLEVEVGASLAKSKYDFANNELEQWIYEASVNWYYNRNLYITGRYEMSTEKYLSVDSVYTAYADSEYKSNSLFLLAGYRF